MKKIFTLIILAMTLPVAIADEGATDAPQTRTDHIFLKDENGKLGYVMTPGEVKDITPDHVLFIEDGSEATYLYTRDDVRRIELGEDDEQAFRSIVDRHWNQTNIFSHKDKTPLEMAFHLFLNFLPGAVLTGFLVLVCLYFLTSTLLQAYQRFVLEGNIKRLNTEKLMSEIDKLRIEVIELRQRLGLSASEEELLSQEDRERAIKSATATRGTVPLEGRISLPGFHLPEFHFIDFFKETILHIRTEKEFEARKQRLVARWQTESETSPGWLRTKYHAYTGAMTIAIWLGWFFALGAVGNIVGYFADPLYQQELGGGVVITVVIMGIALIVAVIRLGQKRKLRKEAYRQVYRLQDIDA